MHIEPTSRCTLFCPACPRTWFTDQFNHPFPKQDLNINDLASFLDCEAGKKIDHFLLNGNHGDPIYYPQLFELIDRFRDTKYFKISTNGSHQTQKFWEKLAGALTKDDTIYFSIDGLEHSNHLYRKNSNWESIMAGLDIMLKSPARVVWKTLFFSYNANEMDAIKKMAEDKGAIFVVESTSRFGDDQLRPANEQLIDVSRFYEKNIHVEQLAPQCETQQYISADGYLWPCCWISSVYTLHKTELWKNRSMWSIKGKTLDQVQVTLKEFKQTVLDNPSNAHPVCKMNCKPGQKFVWATS